MENTTNEIPIKKKEAENLKMHNPIMKQQLLNLHYLKKEDENLKVVN